MKYDLKTFGKRLKMLIEKNYETQESISKRAKIAKSNVSLYCNGKKAMSPKTLIKLCVILNCSHEWLRDGKGSIDDPFNFAKIHSPEPGKLEAHRINDIVEVRFIVSHKNFKDFFIDAERTGCAS